MPHRPVSRTGCPPQEVRDAARRIEAAIKGEGGEPSGFGDDDDYEPFHGIPQQQGEGRPRRKVKAMRAGTYDVSGGVG